MSSMLEGISVDAASFSSRNGARLSLSIDARASAGVVESKLVFYDCNTGGIREHCTVPWKIVSITSSRAGGALRTYALGEDGQVKVVEKESVWDADIRGSRAHVTGLGPLRRIRDVGGVVHAVGMGRQVYRLDARGEWERLNAPYAVDERVLGFETVCPDGHDGLLCAGWRGEIWRRVGDAWERLDSPTNVMITDMTHHAGVFYACGLAGLVVRGDGSRWEVLGQGPFDLNLYSVACHDGRTYFASMYGVYELRGDKLFSVDFGSITPPTTSHTLCPLPDALAVCGAKDILMLDASGWRRLE